jgi:hypothetical protein
MKIKRIKMKKNINLAFYISKANLPKENLKIDNILGKNINSSKNLKPGIYFIETKEEGKRKIIIVSKN